MASTLGSVGVIDKAVLVLDALEGGPCSLTELVEASGLPRATAHRLAVALEGHGLVRRRNDGRFALGYRLLSLGRRATAQIPLVELAGPHLDRLRDVTGESAQLYVADGDERVCVAASESSHGLRTIVSVGSRLTMARGSAGAVLRGEATPVGYRASVGEREPGVASVSAPVVGPDGVVVAAVSVSGPIDRVSRRPGPRYGPQVRAAAAAISADLVVG
ncbi:MAG: IclR family transcriptional regulator [Acidimicrobiales bacterium]